MWYIVEKEMFFSIEWRNKIYRVPLKINKVSPLPVKPEVIFNCFFMENMGFSKPCHYSKFQNFDIKNKWMALWPMISLSPGIAKEGCIFFPLHILQICFGRCQSRTRNGRFFVWIQGRRIQPYCLISLTKRNFRL